jgi:GNAT superfamily N-acetyltransferase
MISAEGVAPRVAWIGDILVRNYWYFDYGVSRRGMAANRAGLAWPAGSPGGAGWFTPQVLQPDGCSAMAASTEASSPATRAKGAFSVRRVHAGDIAHVIALDKRVTGLVKPKYWRDVFERYGGSLGLERSFLVAEALDGKSRTPILGFIIGEVRAWEFGSAPCGWVFALSVEPRARLQGVGEALFDAISMEFKRAGVDKMRTMVARDNQLHLMFFRSEGMTAGPYVQLEKELD